MHTIDRIDFLESCITVCLVWLVCDLDGMVRWRNWFWGLMNEFVVVADEFGALTDEFGALMDEFGALTDEFGALTDEFGALPDEFGALPDEFGALPDEFGLLMDEFVVGFWANLGGDFLMWLIMRGLCFFGTNDPDGGICGWWLFCLDTP